MLNLALAATSASNATPLPRKQQFANQQNHHKTPGRSNLKSDASKSHPDKDVDQADAEASGVNSQPDDPSDHFSMGLKHREKLIDDLKKENFGLKMRVYFLAENLQKMSPEGVREIVNEHAELKAMIEDIKLEKRLEEQSKEPKSESIQVESSQELGPQRSQQDLENALAEATSELSSKKTEAQNLAEELQEMYHRLSTIEQSQADERLAWQKREQKLEMELIEAKSKVDQLSQVQQGHQASRQLMVNQSTSPQKVSVQSVSTMPDSIPAGSITATESQTKRALRAQLAQYEKQMAEYHNISLCTAEEMAFLKAELERQTEKLKKLEARFRGEIDQRKGLTGTVASGDSTEGAVTESGKQRDRTVKRKIELKELSNETRSIIPPSPNKGILSDQKIRDMVAMLHEQIALARVSGGTNSAQTNELIKRLTMLLPSSECSEVNHKRYTDALKQRNLLLVQVNQRLEYMLMDRVSTFKRLQYEELHRVVKDLQGKLEASNLTLTSERETSRKRLAELQETNRRLENELVSCSKLFVALKEQHGPPVKNHV
eukprot:jgi/Hompol1/880/HPOL_005449-RA